MAVAATATPQPVGLPGSYGPNIGVSVTGLTVSTGVTLTLWRKVGGQRAVVRGCRRTAVLGTTMAFTDHEAPFGVNVTYQVDEFTSFGTTLDTAVSAAVQLAVGVAWISDPMSPRTAVSVVLGSESLGEKSYSDQSQVVTLAGSPTPVSVGGVRGIETSVPLRIDCYTALQRFATMAVLQAASPFLLRCPPNHQMPALAYCQSDTVRVLQVDVHMGGELAELYLTCNLVAAPRGDIVVNTRTYADLLGEATDYAGLLATRTTYLEVLTG